MLGIKCYPKVPSIEVSGIILLATHMGIGVDNTIVVAFEDTAEKDTVDVPEEDRHKCRRLEVLATEIEERREVVRTFDTISDGKLCYKLQQQKCSAGKTMSAAESFLLTALKAKLAALRNAHKISKLSGDADAIDLTKRAVALFTAGKDTGK